jgi:paraquat-inducible protein B
MADAEVTVTKRRRISPIWFVPIVALALGIWMVVYTFQSQGPLIHIVFASGSGIEAQKTKIKLRDVEVGLVESVGLTEDLQRVVVAARLEKAVEPLLRRETQFWVVRPRIGPGGVSGLGTMLSGSYIKLAPGAGAEGERNFVGLDDPPVTPSGAPGLHVGLVSDRAGSLGSGDPVIYKGFRVGRIESAEFDVRSQQVHLGAFIEAPFDELVTTSSRFWNASGVSLSANADGFEVQTASLEALLLGGMEFGLPEGVEPGEAVSDGAVFTLHPNRASMNEQPYRHVLEYVVRFPRSLRGLKPGAPVEYRGIRVGQVERLLLAELVGEGVEGRGRPIPVLIRIEPGRFAFPDSEAGKRTLAASIESAIDSGLRATLSTGSLLTGNLYVYLDFYSDVPSAEMGSFAGRPTLPTIESGLAGIERRMSAVLDKVNALPIEATLDQATQMLAELNGILASEDMQALPASLEGTLGELHDLLQSFSVESRMQEQMLRTIHELDLTLESLRQVLDTIDEQPNALIFNREPAVDPRPPAGSQ